MVNDNLVFNRPHGRLLRSFARIHQCSTDGGAGAAPGAAAGTGTGGGGGDDDGGGGGGGGVSEGGTLSLSANGTTQCPECLPL